MTSIDMLPDDVLLEIFDLCADEVTFTKEEIEAWQSLVHVCRRWRSIVFGSPRRLNLRLVCSAKTPAEDTMDIWPALPLIIRESTRPTEGVDNIVTLLERNDRVRQIVLGIPDLPDSQLDTILAAMQRPFPKLTTLGIKSYGTVAGVPNSFLGGSTPRLEKLSLNGIPYPGLPKLLLSATHLVHLRLLNIPRSGHISLEAMLNAFTMLTNLQLLWLEFLSPRSYPDQESRRLPPPTRSILPVITELRFKGVSEYLDDLVACIDAPLLFHLSITFFNDTVFDSPQLVQFISRTPMLTRLEKAGVSFGDGTARVNLSSQTSNYGELSVKIPCRELDWQVSCLEQICTSCLPPLSTLKDLYIYKASYSQLDRQDNIGNVPWLELLHPFTAVKNLYLSKEFAPHIVPALQELVGGRATEVLPTLQNIFLEGLQPSEPAQEGIQQFIAARQFTSHPIAVSRWDRDRRKRRARF
jgi:hypothetical protein